MACEDSLFLGIAKMRNRRAFILYETDIFQKSIKFYLWVFDYHFCAHILSLCPVLHILLYEHFFHKSQNII